MSVEYSAVIIVGLPRRDLESHKDYEDFCNDGLRWASPYYDGFEDAIFGILVADSDLYAARELPAQMDGRIEKAKAEFKDRTGLDGKVFLSVNSY